MFFCFLAISFNLSAKEEMYGNIKMRSLGVGHNPNLPKQNVVLINSNGEIRHYQRNIVGSVADVACVNRGISVYNYPTLQMNTFEKSDNIFTNNEPVATHAIVYYSFGAGDDPSHPGPIKDAIPFIILLAGIYIYLKTKN